jgi:hypothetical protein
MQILKEYIIKGFAMDDERLKNGKYFGKDYFKELLERVRSIRTRFFQVFSPIFGEFLSAFLSTISAAVCPVIA